MPLGAQFATILGIYFRKASVCVAVLPAAACIGPPGHPARLDPFLGAARLGQGRCEQAALPQWRPLATETSHMGAAVEPRSLKAALCP